MRIEWILPGQLAGSARPGLLEPLEDDLDLLQRFGFKLLLTLTESPLDAAEQLAARGLAVEHFPIPDMGAPPPRNMARYCRLALERVERGDKTLVHCKAGLGRTGTFLACCLVHRGHDADDAITQVRLINPRFIQSTVQERFIHHYEEFLAGEEEASSREPADGG